MSKLSRNIPTSPGEQKSSIPPKSQNKIQHQSRFQHNKYEACAFVSQQCQMSHEKTKETALLSMKYRLINRDPYFMAYETIPIYIQVVFHARHITLPTRVPSFHCSNMHKSDLHWIDLEYLPQLLIKLSFF